MPDTNYPTLRTCCDCQRVVARDDAHLTYSAYAENGPSGYRCAACFLAFQQRQHKTALRGRVEHAIGIFYETKNPEHSAVPASARRERRVSADAHGLFD